MRFVAKHFSALNATYFTTLDADDLPEAGKLAKRYNRKGYVVATIVQQLGKD